MILIVEDDFELSRTLQRTLTRLGYQCQTVADGWEATKRRISNGISLILMDIGLPVMDGLQATKEIRKFEKQKGDNQVPIIAFTAGVAEKSECMQAGMNGYLLKPVLTEDLQAVINKWQVPRKGK